MFKKQAPSLTSKAIFKALCPLHCSPRERSLRHLAAAGRRSKTCYPQNGALATE